MNSGERKNMLRNNVNRHNLFRKRVNSAHHQQMICRKNVPVVTDPKCIEFINSKVYQYYKSSQYDHLDIDRLEYLKKSPYYITTKTVGKQYFLLLTKFDRNKCCFLISREVNPTIFSLKLRFGTNLFSDTLMEGELIKDNSDMWIFMVSDLYIDCGNRCNGILSNRISNIHKLLTTGYKKDKGMDIFSIQVKKFFKYQDCRYINQFVEGLSYPIRGLTFVPECNLSAKRKNIFVANDKFTITIQGGKQKSQSYIQKKSPEEHCSSSESVESYSDDDITRQPELFKKQEHTVSYGNFLIKKTGKPDVYELYISDGGESISYYGYACMNTLKTSQFMSTLFSSNPEKERIFVKCRFHTIFKKWIPEEIDNEEKISTKEMISSLEINHN